MYATGSNSNKLIMNTSMSANTFPAEIDAHLAKWNEGHKEQEATREHRHGCAEELGEKNLKHQVEIEAECYVEEEKSAAIKNQVQTAKNSPEAQQHRAAAALKEVAKMQREYSDSVKVQVAQSTRAVENTA